MPELEVRGLVNGDARALLNTTVPFALDERVRDRILAETHGNPLALVELPRGRTPTQLAGGFGIPDAHDLSSQIEKQLRPPGHDAPGARPTVAAPRRGRNPSAIRCSSETPATQLEIAPSAIDATDGLLVVDERVTFLHPLARSAVYRFADAPERRAAHLALAQVTDSRLDPDRRAWHLAAATTGPDEAVAHELELSAGRAKARGGQAAAAAFLQRAVALTGDPERRAERALEAAQANLGAGAFDAAHRLLAIAEAGPLDELGHARIELLRAEIVFAQRRGGNAPLLLLRQRRGSNRSTCASPATRTSTLGARRCSPAIWQVPAARCSTSHGPRRPLPMRADRLPRDLLLDGLASIFADGMRTATPLLRAGGRRVQGRRCLR